MAQTEVGKNEINVDAIYPVGSIYLSVNSTNPSTYFGGTWTAFAAGRTLVGLDAGQTEFDTVEETGGAKTHTLTTSEMPSHTHGSAVGGSSIVSFVGSGGNIDFNSGPRGLGHLATASAGGDGAHNNLQPYITVYMWKRTA